MTLEEWIFKMTKKISNKKNISVNDDITSVHLPNTLGKLTINTKASLNNTSDNEQPMQEVEVRERIIKKKDEKMKVLEYAFDNTKEINDRVIERVAKTRFTLANAYPYIFDSICGLLTNQDAISQKYKRQIVDLMDIPQSIFFMIDIPFAEFLDWALDGEIKQKDRLIENLNNLVNASPAELQKYIPISPKYCAKVAPIQVVLIRKNEEEISESKLKRLKNLTISGINKGTQNEKTISLLPERLPIERIQIHTLKSLFQDLMIGEYGENWFEIPKALQAKIVAFHPEYKKEISLYMETLSKKLRKNPNDEKKEEYETLKNVVERFPSPMILRRAYFYMKLHLSSNKLAKKINIDTVDFFTHVDPSYLRENKSGQQYTIGGGKRASAFLDLAYNFFMRLEKKCSYSGKHLKHPAIKNRATP
jgi:hypothetical protein